MNMIRLSLCFLLLSLSIGCKTSGPSIHETKKAYAVRAIFVDVPTALLEELNLSWMIDSSKINKAAEGEDVIEKLYSSPQARTTEFPVVYLNAGERKKIDKQKPVKYPTAYTWDGKPTDYETRGVGRLIEIDLKSVTDGWATCSYHIEDVDVHGWTSYKIGTSSRKIKQPIFRMRDTSSSPDMMFMLNNWMIGGGMIFKSKDRTERIEIFAIQVQENKKAQQTNTPYSSPATGLKR